MDDGPSFETKRVGEEVSKIGRQQYVDDGNRGAARVWDT